MKLFSLLVTVLCTTAILVGVSGAQKTWNRPADTLAGVLRVHPKFHYRYFVDGFGDGQHCALFGADKRLSRVEPGSAIRVRGDLASKLFGGDPRDKTPALARTWIIYMNVDQVEVLRGPVRLPSPEALPPRTAKSAQDKE